METRTSDKINLINYDEHQIFSANFPSNIQVLGFLFYNMKKMK